MRIATLFLFLLLTSCSNRIKDTSKTYEKDTQKETSTEVIKNKESARNESEKSNESFLNEDKKDNSTSKESTDKTSESKQENTNQEFTNNWSIKGAVGVVKVMDKNGSIWKIPSTTTTEIGNTNTSKLESAINTQKEIINSQKEIITNLESKLEQKTTENSKLKSENEKLSEIKKSTAKESESEKKQANKHTERSGITFGTLTIVILVSMLFGGIITLAIIQRYKTRIW